ncbi:MAG: sugar O-acyltransferase [Flavobacterium sp. MedPE-SWcel]|uniref:acetyltransferase n=1 Tax=uncultured Flavobacterium sp. TaxID=165435 RepID=UPI0009217557|nr:acetyltransferase [uncultured Flavobacterium sp.]OIQ21448.1 MAG: sugar O-acyltransferase [Flavobacterium sp. MedPE-SWcel]
MEQIIIIGAGGHAAEIDEYLTHTNLLNNQTKYKVVGFIDDNAASYDGYEFSAPYLGTIKDHKIDGSCSYIMGIANLKFRKIITEDFGSKGVAFSTFIHPLAYVSPSSKIGKGVVVAPYVNVGPNVVIGDFTLINSRASMGHDTKVGKFNFISPNVCFSGFTSIGDENLFGINSASIPKITIGNRNKIAAGMIVERNIDDDTTYFHRFKEKVLAIPKA